MSGTLYLVPTPIGNLGDISRRIADTLEQADFIAAEDTRVTLKLLNHLGIKKPMVSYYRHNTAAGGEAVLRRLLSGESCALVTDAGTPAISDPGEELVALCGISRQTFYYHFEDVLDVVDWWTRQGAQQQAEEKRDNHG